MSTSLPQPQPHASEGGRPAKQDGAARKRGRPRDARADVAILDATRQILAQEGWDALTIERVASDAGVARTTVYRRYPTREELAVAAVATLFPDDIDDLVLPPVTPLSTPLAGSRTLAAVRQFAFLLEQPMASASFPAVIAAAQSNPRLREALDDTIITPMRARIHRMMQEGVNAGFAPPAVATEEWSDLIFDLVAGAMVHRLLVRQQPITEEFQVEMAKLIRAMATGALPH